MKKARKGHFGPGSSQGRLSKSHFCFFGPPHLLLSYPAPPVHPSSEAAPPCLRAELHRPFWLLGSRDVLLISPQVSFVCRDIGSLGTAVGGMGCHVGLYSLSACDDIPTFGGCPGPLPLHRGCGGRGLVTTAFVLTLRLAT